MRVLIQRVNGARVEVADETLGQIDQGLLVFAGFVPEDGAQDLAWITRKLLGLRIFPDDKKPMNLSVQEISGGVLLVPQFTLAADTNSGMRPSFTSAAPPKLAEALFEQFVQQTETKHQPIACGRFGANMQVHLINDGPVTFWLDSRQRSSP